ncbi:MAG: sugar ABC transporter permease [Natronomonas sp.]|uniref:carbohydrate ABC transporter permease n=1 Tax=Natronomonas sp. TaxID=2184060 RepID=UPI00287084D4|nr:sugar ABC transporter permease [Natronomonas sp.]MDR9431542.1 sugar ABC transporter permease [Natronomonas sp.]
MSNISDINDRIRRSRLGSGVWSVDWTPYYYITPLVLIYLAFLAFPVGYALLISFQDFTTVTNNEWVGLENYANILTDSRFYNALTNTALYAVGTVVLPIVIGLAMALVLNDERVKGNTLFRGMIFLPYVVPIVVVGVLFGWVFTEFGIVNALLSQAGLIAGPVPWLSRSNYAMPTLIVLATWRGVGFNMVIFLAGLQSIPDEIYEAARIQGKSRWKMFRSLTLPLLKPSLTIAIILGALAALRGFAEIWVMTQGGPSGATSTLGVYFYREAFIQNNFGKGAAIGFIMFVIALVLSVLIVWYSEDKSNGD